jgi:hypothetical protein
MEWGLKNLGPQEVDRVTGAATLEAMPVRSGRWETTPYRDTALTELLEDQFAWTLAPIDG